MSKKLSELWQKVEKKIAEQKESLVKLEAGSEDENECLISTSNKFGTLAKLSDKKIKKIKKSEKTY